MATSLAVIDRELTARLPIFQQVLPPSVSPQRLMRTVLMSIERNPRLLECQPQSIVNAATTAAVLGLEVDGVTGQGFIIPYKGSASFQIGYKGYSTLAARAGYTINGGVVREGDEFDFALGSGGFVRHKPLLVDLARRRIVAAWATAESHGRPNIVVVMSIEEVEAIRARSPGARKTDSPWNDATGPGYAAMVEKTAKRRLARSMPLSVMQQAAALEDAHDRGGAAWLEPGGDLRVVGEAAAGPAGDGVIVDRQPDDILSPANPIAFPSCRTVAEFKSYSEQFLASATPAQADAWEAHYRDKIAAMGQHAREDVRAIAHDLLAEFVRITAPDQAA